MSKFEDFGKAVGDGVANIAKGDLKDFLKEAKDDTNQFLATTKEDLKTWTKQLADGDLSKDEFEFLVRGKDDLAEMHALTQAGIAAAQVQKFRDALIDLVIDTAFRVFVPTI
jgi:hypothetical protein